MTNTAHTPGPWSLSKPSGIYIDAPTGCIAALNYGALEGDARLIAAAPDLLAALENLVLLSDRIDRSGATNKAVYNDAIAAIAKAKGSITNA